MSFGVTSLMTLGEVERAREWMSRALLVDPDNINMRYNFACALAAQLKDVDAALDMLGPTWERMTRGFLNLAKVDPDMDSLRADPRFKAMITQVEARLDAEEGR
jgi:adenylate cyclase